VIQYQQQYQPQQQQQQQQCQSGFLSPPPSMPQPQQQQQQQQQLPAGLPAGVPSTPLLAAVVGGHFQAAELLLDHVSGDDSELSALLEDAPPTLDDNGLDDGHELQCFLSAMRPLDVAVRDGKVSVVRLLLLSGANPNQAAAKAPPRLLRFPPRAVQLCSPPPPPPPPPLVVACGRGHREVVRLLLSAGAGLVLEHPATTGAGLPPPPSACLSPLFTAVTKGDVACVRLFLRTHQQRALKNSHTTRPRPTMRRLLEEKFNGFTPLLFACVVRCSSVAQFLTW